MTRQTIVIDPCAREELRASLLGELIGPEDDAYDETRAVWNAMIDRRPGLIVRARGVADVVDAVNFARTRRLLTSVRGGGHNVAGYAVCEGGLMIDLSAMRVVHVDAKQRRAWVQGGATWRDVDRETQAFGLATPGGLISATGVGGLTLSGGIGWLRGKYGLSLDNLLSVEIVTADGQVRTASESENGELFWAVRGGGGNFGVVTSFEFRLHPVGPVVMFCAPAYDEADAGKILPLWRDFMAGAPDEVSGLAEFSAIPSDPSFPEAARGMRVVSLATVHAGSAEAGERALQPLRELGTPVVDFSGRMPYRSVQSIFDALFPKAQHRCYWKSLYLDRLDDQVIGAILRGLALRPSEMTYASIWPMGGAVARVPAQATAFGDRSMPYMLSLDAIWKDRHQDDANIAWTRTLWSQMHHYSDGRLYLNFPGMGEEGEELVRAAFGRKAYDRLVAAKNAYDPENLFRMNQNIKPTVGPAVDD